MVGEGVETGWLAALVGEGTIRLSPKGPYVMEFLRPSIESFKQLVDFGYPICYLLCEDRFAFCGTFRRKDCASIESNIRSRERARARRDITVPAGQSNIAAIS